MEERKRKGKSRTVHPERKRKRQRKSRTAPLWPERKGESRTEHPQKMKAGLNYKGKGDSQRWWNHGNFGHFSKDCNMTVNAVDYVTGDALEDWIEEEWNDWFCSVTILRGLDRLDPLDRTEQDTQTAGRSTRF